AEHSNFRKTGQRRFSNRDVVRYQRKYGRYSALYAARCSGLCSGFAEETRAFCCLIRDNGEAHPQFVAAPETAGEWPCGITRLGHFNTVRFAAVRNGKGREIGAPAQSADHFYRRK